MSQRALGVAAGIPQSTIARIETGMLAPRTTTLERLLTATGHSLTTEPRVGVGVDRSQIRAMLERSVAQRVRMLSQDAKVLRALDRARVRRP